MQKKIKKIGDEVNKVSLPSIITESAIKIVLNSVPVIGNALNEIIFGIGSKIKVERLEKLTKFISEKINDMETEQINKEYLKSEEFYDLLLEILSKASKSKSEQKLKALSEILVRSITEESDFDSDLNSTFITYIDELKTKHIELLAFFKDKEQELVEIGSYDNLFKIFRDNFPDSSLDKYEFKLYCSKLEAMVLISTGRGLYDFDAVGGYMAIGGYKPPSLKITSIGKRFLEYLNC
jgi:hypothetical protein